MGSSSRKAAGIGTRTAVARLTSSQPLSGTVAAILFIADDGYWTTATRNDLLAEGFAVEVDTTGETAYDDQAIARADLALVDLGFRRQSGVAVCAALRARSSVPIVGVGTAREEATVLAAFSAGIDQFAPVDGSTRQLVARLRALLRRFPPGNGLTAAAPSVTSIVLDDEGRTARLGGVVVALSAHEQAVLRLLLARPGRVVSRAELLAAHSSRASNDRTLDFVIRRLREKLEAAEPRRRITAVRGVGFRFDEVVGVDGSEPV